MLLKTSWRIRINEEEFIMKRTTFFFLIGLLAVLILGIHAVFAGEDSAAFYSTSYDIETGEETAYAVPENGDSHTDRTEGREASPITGVTDLFAVSLVKPDADIPPYTIFYPDDREIVRFSPDNQPYINITRITTNKGSCSGFMIGPHYVATAAHCLYDDEAQKWAGDFKICPSYSKGNSPYGCAGASHLWILDSGINREYDVGVIQLDKDLGTRTGWLGSWVISDSQTKDYAMILGYASDYDMDYMFYSYGYLQGTARNGNMLLYKMDDLPGSSGGPIVMPYGDNNYTYVVGIIVSENDEYNFAVRMTDTVYDFLHDFWGK